MPASLSTIASLIIMELNANTSYSSSVTDPRFYTVGISDTILNIDGQIVAARCMNSSDPRRKNYLTTQSSVAHASQLTTRAGPLESVHFVRLGGTWPFQDTEPAEPTTLEQIRIDNVNANSLTYLPPRFAFVGDTIYHNQAGIQRIAGLTVRVDVMYPVYTRTAACQAPEEDTPLIVKGSLEALFPVEGTNVGAASQQGQSFTRDLSMLRGAA